MGIDDSGWHALELDAVLKRLAALRDGLRTEQAEKRSEASD